MSRTRSISFSEPLISTADTGNGAYNPDWYNPTRKRAATPFVGSFVPYSSVKVMTDEVTPHWFRCRNEGKIIVNPLSVVETRWYRTAMSISREAYAVARFTRSGYPDAWGFGSNGWDYTGTYVPERFLGSTFLSAPSVDNVKDLAVTSSWSKTSEQDAMGLVILAEGEKTIKSFISIGWRLIKILRALRRWDVGWLSRQFSPKELSDRWMEGRYAIRPVVYDMMDCIKAAHRNLAENPSRKTYRGGASDTDSVSAASVLTATFSGDSAWYARKQTQRSISARAGVLAAIDEVTAATSWGLNQPFTALWELIPFSFVVDWFFDVGKTIAAWSPSYGLRPLASWVTVVDTVTSSITFDHCVDLYTQNYGYGYYSRFINASGGSITKVVSTKTRLTQPTRPILPTWKVRLDWAKFLDLAIMGKRFLR